MCAIIFTYLPINDNYLGPPQNMQEDDSFTFKARADATIETDPPLQQIFKKLNRCLPAAQVHMDYLSVHPDKGKMDKLQLLFLWLADDDVVKREKLQHYFNCQPSSMIAKPLPVEKYRSICMRMGVDPVRGLRRDDFVDMEKNTSNANIHGAFLAMYRKFATEGERTQRIHKAKHQTKKLVLPSAGRIVEPGDRGFLLSRRIASPSSLLCLPR
eukprot:jgi/Bigna1/139772/aug1.52_g14480